MARGGAARPLEASNGSTIDVLDEGRKALQVHDPKLYDLLLQISEKQDKILLALEVISGERL